MDPKEQLSPKDQLNLYLVEQGIKPATHIAASDLGMSEEEAKEPFTQIQDSLTTATHRTSQALYAGKDQEALEQLVNAKSDEERGRAYGFPEEAIKQYHNIIDGERRDGVYLHNNLAKAANDAPTWLAYISHIPEQLDIASGNIARTSEALGKQYQSFVREHNPKLAAQVEQAFSEDIQKTIYVQRRANH